MNSIKACIVSFFNRNDTYFDVLLSNAMTLIQLSPYFVSDMPFIMTALQTNMQNVCCKWQSLKSTHGYGYHSLHNALQTAYC